MVLLGGCTPETFVCRSATAYWGTKPEEKYITEEPSDTPLSLRICCNCQTLLILKKLAIFFKILVTFQVCSCIFYTRLKLLCYRTRGVTLDTGFEVLHKQRMAGAFKPVNSSKLPWSNALGQLEYIEYSI